MVRKGVLSIAAAIAVATLLSSIAQATIFGSVRGIIHDPQHRPVQDAMVMSKRPTPIGPRARPPTPTENSRFKAVPLGEYSVTVAGPGFAQTQQNVVVMSGTEPVLHFGLNVAGTPKKPSTSPAAPEVAPTDSATPTTLVDRLEIARTPGADRTNSLAMITDYVPGAYITHDQLHIRGGHQTSWLIDGVPVPNTNIASNIGPQFDPKDIDYIEVSRGSYGAEFGDRTYGVFNVVPRTGFERNNQAELVTQLRKFLPDQRSIQLRQPHRALRLLRQRERQPQQSRHPNARAASRSRRRERLRRLRFAHLQRRSRATSCASSLRCARISTRFPTIRIPTTSKSAHPGKRFHGAISQHRSARQRP